MLTAIVAIEDDRFWQHGALDVKGTIRALVNDLEHKPIQGGSTLEQQYVKNVLVLQALDSPAAQQAATADNLSRKLDQLRMAVEVAHTMSKQQILAGYLNDSYYGNGAVGHRGGGRDVLQHHRRQAHHDPGGHAGRHRGEPDAVRPHQQPGPGADAAQHGARADRRRPTRAALSTAAATVLGATKLGVHPGAKQSGCTASTAGEDAFFCDYVIHAVLNDPSSARRPRTAPSCCRPAG